MDPRLLRYYNQELRYLREMGGEFAREFPKIAGRLGISIKTVETHRGHINGKLSVHISADIVRLARISHQKRYRHAIRCC